MTLYELTGQWLALYEMADDPEINPQTWADTMESVEGEIEQKAEGYAMVMAQIAGDMAAIKEQEKRLHARYKTLESRMESMKAHLETAMRVTGKTKFKTTLFSFNIAKNPPSAAIDDESKIPAGWWIPQQPKLDKEGILRWLKDGNTCDWAHIAQGESLRIR